MMDNIGHMSPIADSEIRKYIQRILEDFTEEQFTDMFNQANSYAKKIKEKIQALSDEFAEKKFREYLDTDQVFIKPSYSLPAQIIPGLTAKDITKGLYEKEGWINEYEESVINEVANLSNILFWTRNLERKGFCINGFINHYPDFIIQTKSGKTIILETKGDHLYAEEKIRLGEKWATKSGNSYRYFMVYGSREVAGSYTLDAFMNIISKM
jgi:type III restriction enzyme